MQIKTEKKLFVTKLHGMILLMVLSVSVNAFAEEKLAYSTWVHEFKQEALEAGISKRTVNATFKDAKLLPLVVQMDRAQPEFISPFLDYLAKRVTPEKIEQGRNMLQRYAGLLSDTEAKFGVPANILVAFWGMETNYGTNQGNFGLPSSLMTLAYDGRRASFFREQLIDVMRIVEAGHMPLQAMRGSWAGALGHMQFMPSTMLQYGVDADGDGKVDLKSSMPDVFASAANYLRNVGWKQNEPIMLEVRLPEQFDYVSAQLALKKSTTEWKTLGVTAIDGSDLPESERAAILLPQGWRGPALMVFPNFEVVMDWNRSVNYALSVVHLAANLVSDTVLKGGAEAEAGALSFNQLWALQLKLNALGYDCGAPDGFPGLKTQSAIRQYQASQRLPEDGYASPSLFERLLSD